MDIIFFWKILGTFAVFLVFLDPYNTLIKSIGDEKTVSSNLIRLFAFIVWAASVSTLTYFIWWH